jgi:hypothetical protein
MKTETGPYKGVSYESLLDGSVDSSTPNIQSRRRGYWSFTVFSAGCMTMIAIAAITLSFGHVQVLRTPKTAAEVEAEDWNSCGRSSKVAMERGCVMEPLLYAWMPSQCVYPELSAQWPVFEDRVYWSDTNYTTQLTPAQLWAGEAKQIFIHAK